MGWTPSLIEADDRKRSGDQREGSVPLFDFDSNESPIYLQLITIFRRQIAVGTWPLNTRIPTIENLAAQYGVANGTVRQALSFLEREGLVRRMRRRGTYVMKLPVQQDPIVLPRTRDQLADMLKQLKRAARPVGTTEVARLRRTNRIYSRGSTIVMLEHERADPDLVAEGEIALALLGREPFRAMTIDQAVTIGTADTDTAQQLNIPVNAPVALVRHNVTDASGETAIDCEWLMRGDLLNLVEHYSGPGDAT